MPAKKSKAKATKKSKSGSAKKSAARKESTHVTIEEAEKKAKVKGKITLDKNVVATIAAMAARNVKGIHQIGASRLLSVGKKLTRGVEVEVGKIQAAFDVDIILEYGRDIKEVAEELRGRIAGEVSKMAGREVVEININVVDIKLPEETKEEETRVL